MYKEFDFTKDDLITNRAGKLSTSQNERLDAYLIVAKRLSRFSVFVGVASISIIIGIAFFMEEFNRFLEILPYLLIVAFIFLSIFSIFVFLGSYRLRRLEARQVQVVEGKAQLSSKKIKNGQWTAYYVTIDKIKFQIQPNQYKALQNGVQYQIFFIHYPPTHWILSIEETNHNAFL